MDTVSQAAVSLSVAESEPISESSVMANDDQFFLLYFIIGTYFGPDLRGERPERSILHRRAEGLSTYTLDQLAGSHMKTVEVERVYYYVLRKAERSLTVKLSLLHRFFHGNVCTAGNEPAFTYPQFPDLFPPELHPHSRFKNRYKIIENIIFISDPDTSYIKPEDVDRFKRLTGLENLVLDRDAARLHTPMDGSGLYNVAVQEAETHRQLYSTHPPPFCKPSADSILQSGNQHVHVMEPLSSIPCPTLPPTYSYPPYRLAKDDTQTAEEVSPGMIFLPSSPNKKEWTSLMAANKSGFALTGSAAKGQVGHIVGLMDIGECDDAYLFRVSLPGVKRDESKFLNAIKGSYLAGSIGSLPSVYITGTQEEFSCEVENDGKVLIKGVTTTGEKTVYRFCQMFEMQSQNLCPPGQFSIAFQLPGPVNPQQFSGHFGTDGILEGIVMKGRNKVVDK